MKNLFEQSRSHWVRYDHYEMKTAGDGNKKSLAHKVRQGRLINRVTTLIRTQLTHTCLTEFHQTPAALTGGPVAALRQALGAQLRNHVHPNPPRPVPTLRSSLCRSFRATLSFTVFEV